MNRVEGTHWFRGKRMPCSVNNVQTQSAQVPVGSHCIQVRPAVGGRSFIDFSERNRTDQHAITLYEYEIGGQYKLGTTEHFADAAAGRFPEQPRQHRAGLRIDVHRVPRSSSRSTAARCRFRIGESFGYNVASFDAPSVSCPLLASAISPEGTPLSSSPCPGGRSSATTSPRSVTSTPSPDRTSRTYSLRRFFSSRSPTLFIISM